MSHSAPREAIILAGGFGTRLQTVVSELPKPMAPVAGKPFLQYILDDCHKQNINRVILAVGYLRNAIIDYFGSDYRGIEIVYSAEEEPLGTGGAILQACNHTHRDNCFVINGDTFFQIDLAALAQFHFNKKAVLSVALKQMEKFDRYGTVSIDEVDRIIAFHEKKYLVEGLINGGVYCLDKKIFHSNLPQKFSFENEILEKQFSNRSIYGKCFDGYFIDIGIPEDYERAQIDFSGH